MILEGMKQPKHLLGYNLKKDFTYCKKHHTYSMDIECAFCYYEKK